MTINTIIVLISSLSFYAYVVSYFISPHMKNEFKRFESDTLIGMNQEKVIELLGRPQSTTQTELEYLVREKYGNNIDPEYISNLVIELDNKRES